MGTDRNPVDPLGVGPVRMAGGLSADSPPPGDRGDHSDLQPSHRQERSLMQMRRLKTVQREMFTAYSVHAVSGHFETMIHPRELLRWYELVTKVIEESE